MAKPNFKTALKRIVQPSTGRDSKVIPFEPWSEPPDEPEVTEKEARSEAARVLVEWNRQIDEKRRELRQNPPVGYHVGSGF